MKQTYAAFVTTLIVLISISPVSAHQHELALADIAKNDLPKWLYNPLTIDGIKAQNSKTRDMSEAEIIKLDNQWREEVDASSQPLITEVLSSPLSAYLKQVKANSQGLFTEIFVMDAKGINVGQSDVTSDYWQGDEAKWQKTFPEGPKAIHVGEIDLDESTQQFQSQLSVSIVDPASGSVIGAITVGINLDEL